MKRIKKILALVLAIAAVLAIAVPAFAYTKTAVSGTRYIYASNGLPVNVRTGPGTSYSKAAVSTFAIGTKVTLSYKATGSDNTTWYECYNSSNQGGWVRSDFLVTSIPGGGDSSGWLDRYGSADYGPSSTYKAGMVKVQEDLNTYFNVKYPSHKYESWQTLSTDGYYGSKTETAVRMFQGKNGLVIDSWVGNATKELLYSKTH